MSVMLGKSFFNRSAVKVAHDLIGCVLVRRVRGRTRRFLITEVEAYEGPKDLASHASRGKTKRNEIMFGPAGYIYVYFVYGMHWMLNIVTGKKDYPAAVLIRDIEGYSGPARLTKALSITGELNCKLLGKKIGLWIESGMSISSKNILRTPRIGVAYAGPVWSKKLYRFLLKEK
ncbi:MAG: 3-methyladenine DNA glycosylase [Candidatus Taylorbacteria bacterium RIFCSPHIGHO2_01_FULL_46_22b]|uniref:Putative 3-methyladenine DNA glycosylase n=1 Tax=Candidatus Taylorbacteria bacterium RIFCSPHIGHO2_01_FULL_46_22b TaxID=1802301 RepID=A0A1G2M3S3_9BACT|nr:MAG: 3-methyladenine DNA glycosylase [Candidatus Taylorbacteria bacterium RIFCSPHIGHO2_01_FULL_46_22b]